jgi:hypothetical protein
LAVILGATELETLAMLDSAKIESVEALRGLVRRQ